MLSLTRFTAPTRALILPQEVRASYRGALEEIGDQQGD
jgi:hypothetical protein